MSIPFAQASNRMRRTVRLALWALALGATPAYAFNNAACLLMGRVEQVERQPLQEVLLRLHLQGVSDNNVHANEVECSKVFRTGSRLWVSMHINAFADSPLPKAGDPAWLSLRYMSGNTVLRKYEWISRKAYLERKDGIQRPDN